ncbi:ATP-dependent 6-phosphofructokinase [Micromonospora sp. BRA006-A]|nr:ATP-dependent 6-phosphofructokinase [Micromonospora sp. BRA006-A]
MLQEDEQIMRIGVLTGGGDCPGLNAVIRAVVRKGVATYGHEFVGFRDGWKGRLEGLTTPLGIAEVRGILPRGGTILGSSRTNPFKIENGVERIKDNLAAQGVDALIAIGGEDTLGVATKLHELGVNVIGVPKTIDNDLGATDYTFGFDTAVNIAMEAIDRLHTTAESHHRTLVVEVMGRHAGWIALHAGLAGGANVILLPGGSSTSSRSPATSEALPAPVRPDRRGRRGRPAAGRPDGAAQPGAGRVRSRPSRRHRPVAGRAAGGEDRQEARTVVLGHIQRGGTPTAFDRVLATRLGLPRSTPRTRATGARWSRCRARTSSASRSPTPPAS